MSVVVKNYHLLLQVIGRCFELDKKPLVEPMLNMWISVVSLAVCTAGSLKIDFDQVLETDMADSESHTA